MKNWFQMNKSQRMQIKAFVCLLGFLLIVILLLAKIAGLLFQGGEQEEEPPGEIHIPTVERMRNIWIMEEDEEGILVFYDGRQERFAWGESALAGGVSPEEASDGASGEEATDGGSEVSSPKVSSPKAGSTGTDSPEAGSTAVGSPEIGGSEVGSPADAASGSGAAELYRPGEPVREQLADVTLTDGLVTEVSLKKEKINGRVLSADDSGVEVEGYGKLPLAADYRAYRLYGSLEMGAVQDIFIGYDFADFCLEDGAICGILLAREAATEYIRVLIRATDYSGLLHMEPVVTADTDFKILYDNGRKEEAHRAGEEIVFSYDSPYFIGERVTIVPDVLTGRVKLSNVNRSQGTPSYRGRLELLRTQEGIAIINEVLLEEYLYSVVPSEMPSGYPPEALKAQAICARTYAYGHISRAGYPRYGAHVDDSAAYQVYNNINEQASTTGAVKDTYGKLLYTAGGGLAETYYYSTSCGVGSDANVWKTESAVQLTYLQPKRLSRAAMAEALSGQAAAAGRSAAQGEAGVSQSPSQESAGADQSALQEDAAAAAAELPLGEQLRDEETFDAFIRSKDNDDFEAKEGWYRWTYKVKNLDSACLLEAMQRRYAANSSLVLTLEEGEYVSREIRGLGKVSDIYVAKRGAGGIADELVIESEEGTYKVISEHNIRYILNDGKSSVLRQDGKKSASANLLPSAFLVLTVSKKDGTVTGYSISGGGFGHGVGMSQNGAKEMAKSGWSAEDILTYFYEGCAARSIYE